MVIVVYYPMILLAYEWAKSKKNKNGILQYNLQYQNKILSEYRDVFKDKVA